MRNYLVTLSRGGRSFFVSASSTDSQSKLFWISSRIITRSGESLFGMPKNVRVGGP